MRSAHTSTGSPMDTHTSVYSTSAPLAALAESSSKVRVAPVSAAIFWHSATRAASGWYFLGAQAVKFRPILAQPTIKLLPML